MIRALLFFVGLLSVLASFTAHADTSVEIDTDTGRLRGTAKANYRDMVGPRSDAGKGDWG